MLCPAGERANRVEVTPSLSAAFGSKSRKTEARISVPFSICESLFCTSSLARRSPFARSASATVLTRRSLALVGADQTPRRADDTAHQGRTTPGRPPGPAHGFFARTFAGGTLATADAPRPARRPKNGAKSVSSPLAVSIAPAAVLFQALHHDPVEITLDLASELSWHLRRDWRPSSPNSCLS